MKLISFITIFLAVLLALVSARPNPKHGGKKHGARKTKKAHGKKTGKPHGKKTGKPHGKKAGKPHGKKNF